MRRKLELITSYPCRGTPSAAPLGIASPQRLHMYIHPHPHTLYNHNHNHNRNNAMPPKRASQNPSTSPSNLSSSPSPFSSSNKPTKSSSSSSAAQTAQQVLLDLWQHYLRTTPQRVKLVDAFMGFLVGVGALQFAYCVLVGNYVGGSFLFFFVFFHHHLLLAFVL